MARTLEFAMNASALRGADERVSAWMRRAGGPMLRIALALVFVWFGALKFLGVSPAADLVARTVYWGVDPAWFIPVLGWWEVLIGICLLDPGPRLGLGRLLTRVGILLLFLQMPGTFLPLVLLPEVTWQRPLVPTIEGQYILKNIVIIGAALVLGGRVRREEAQAAASQR
jgi:uncharacterized membrane protein YkgB